MVVIGKLGNGRRLPRPLQTHKHDHIRLPLLHLIGLGAGIDEADEFFHYCALDHFPPVQPCGGLGQIDLFFDSIPQGLDHFNIDIGLEERPGDFAEEGVEDVVVHDL